MGKKKSTYSMGQRADINIIKNFKYNTGEREIDVTPLFVFMCGLFYGNDDKALLKDMCRTACLQEDLAKATVGKDFWEYLNKNKDKINFNSGVNIEDPLYVSDRTKSLYKNIAITLLKTIQISDHLVFLNINYDFSNKLFDFLHISILFELYKLCLADPDIDKKLLTYANAFFAQNSLIPYTEKIKGAIIVPEGEKFLDYVFDFLEYLLNPYNLKPNLEEQKFFKNFVSDFPDIVTFLSTEYKLEDLAKFFLRISSDEGFSVYYADKAKPFYKECPYVPLLSLTSLAKKMVLYEFDNFIRKIWAFTVVNFYTACNKEKIRNFETDLEKIKKENRNLTRNFSKISEENKKLLLQAETFEEKKKNAVQKAFDEKEEIEEELELVKAENMSLKNKLAKLSNRLDRLTEKVKTQHKIFNRIPNLSEFLNSDLELDAVTEEEQEYQEDEKPSVEEMKKAIRDKRLFFVHGIQRYEKHLEEIFDRYEHVCVNDKIANFTIPQDIDGVVILVKTIPHAHLERALKMKGENVPFIPSTNKNINLVIEDIYNHYFKNIS